MILGKLYRKFEFLQSINYPGPHCILYLLYLALDTARGVTTSLCLLKFANCGDTLAQCAITRHMDHVSLTGYCQLVVARHVRYGHSRGGPQSSVLLIVIHPDFCRISIDNFLTEFLLMIHVMCTFNSILLHVICCFLSRCLCEPHDSVLVRSVHSYIPDQAAVSCDPPITRLSVSSLRLDI